MQLSVDNSEACAVLAQFDSDSTHVEAIAIAVNDLKNILCMMR